MSTLFEISGEKRGRAILSFQSYDMVLEVHHV